MIKILKSILSILIIFTIINTSFALKETTNINITKYSNKEYNLTKSEQKIYNILETFYIKLDKKYLNTHIEKIKILENINFKIKKLKLKNKNNKKVLNILNYIEYNISNRIFWYNSQIFEDTLENKNILIKTNFEKNIFLKEKISESD